MWCAEALELAGVDFMTVSPAVWEQLNEAATLQGYNDGFTASSGESGLQQRLSKEVLTSDLALCRRSACSATCLAHCAWFTPAVSRQLPTPRLLKDVSARSMGSMAANACRRLPPTLLRSTSWRP